MDICCNSRAYRQDFNPDNELAVAVNPKFPDHVLAGSNDYFYRFNNSTGARQALVPTGFFTTFDGGQHWIDGQIPVRSGNGAGDPSPAFVGKLSSATPRTAWAMMAQLENPGGQGGPFVAQGDVSVSYSGDGGVTWSSPVTVFKGTGTGIGPANQASLLRQGMADGRQQRGCPYYGRAYLTTTRFLNGAAGLVRGVGRSASPTLTTVAGPGPSRRRSPAATRAAPSRRPAPSNECDEDQFSIPEVAGTVTSSSTSSTVRTTAAWESAFEFDDQIMVAKSTERRPVLLAAQAGRPDRGRRRRHRLQRDRPPDRHRSPAAVDRGWATSPADPTDPDHVTVVFADNFATADSGPAGCTELRAIRAPPGLQPVRHRDEHQRVPGRLDRRRHDVGRPQ